MSLIVSRLTMILLPLFALLLSHVRAQQGFFPPAIPLAVRSPYLNCWLQSATGPNASVAALFGSTWPVNSNINNTQILGWSVLVRVDGLTYSFLGAVPLSLNNGTVNLTSIATTPTQTVVTAQAGPMQVNLTFLNPIEPGDWVKQSIPFSYMTFTATSTDGASHAVQVYSDVSGEWNSGDRSQTILWTPTSNADVVFHSVTLQTQVKFTEVIDQAEWGTLYYAMQAGNGVTYQIASDTDSRGNFTHNGVLNNNIDPAIRPVSNNFTVFSISRNLGTIKATQAPVVWAIGYTMDSVINYTDLSGAPPTSRSPYYKTQYSHDDELASIDNISCGDDVFNNKVQIVDFLKDFSNALTRARNLDNKILQLANSVSNNLGDLVSASIVQVFGSMQLTIGADTHGNLNKSDIMMFMKNLGAVQVQKNRVNAVETLYAAFPALLSIDSSLGAPLLEPLFRFQASRNYTIPYAGADLGSNYPNVSGSNSNHSQGVEQTANMLIMTYAHARASGDGSLISRHYKSLTSWADYLGASTLVITDQSSADNLTVSNQTNLAIKGIIAIEAMSKMSAVVKQTDDVNKYSNATTRLYTQWKSLALGSDQHILAAYGQSNSWTLGYNLFADVWLGTNLVESSVYDGHSNFIHNLVLTSNFSTYGMPVDNLDADVAVSSWSLFAAAMTSNQGLRSDLISKVFNRVNRNRNIFRVFPVYYDSSQGVALQGAASPAQGAMLAPLALQVPVQTINANGVTTGKPPPSRKKQTIAAIAGGVIGGVVVISALVGIALFVQRRWRQRRRRARPRSILSFSTVGSNSFEDDPQAMVTPFDPNSYSSEEIAIQGSRNLSWTEQQPLMATAGPEGEMVALHGLSQTSNPPNVVPRSRPVAPVPAGLSNKQVARLRAEALARGSHRRSHSGSSPNASHSKSASSSANTVTESSGTNPTIDTQRLHSEVESLRREMERLRTEGVIIEAPPSYTEDRWL